MILNLKLLQAIDKIVLYNYNYSASRGVAQMVECLVWDQDAAGSSPVTSTIVKISRLLYNRLFCLPQL